MDRFKNVFNVQLQPNESLVSNDYNWDELSVGDNTAAGDRFFGFHKRSSEENLNDFRFQFEDTTSYEIGTNENGQMNGDADNSMQSSSDTLSSSLDDVHIGAVKATPPNKKRPNIVNKPLAMHNAKVPNVYLAVQRSREKHRLQMEKIVRDEREQRKFHAKPAPNFKSIHAHRRRAPDEPRITVPVTPKVVHHHRENLKKKEIKLMELEAALRPKPFVSKEADVLFKEPFVPQQARKPPTELKPFNLQSDERLRERRQFDENIRIERERKEREEEERLKVEDEMIRREIRKATTFKASPNPFH